MSALSTEFDTDVAMRVLVGTSLYLIIIPVLGMCKSYVKADICLCYVFFIVIQVGLVRDSSCKK